MSNAGRILALALSVIVAAPGIGRTTEPAAPNPPEETPLRFQAQSGEQVDALAGRFSVPENWDEPASRRLVLHYVRFPALGPERGAPIVYLAGGPGGSGIQTARHERFPLFMAMRRFGDVIALASKGTFGFADLTNLTDADADKVEAALAELGRMAV